MAHVTGDRVKDTTTTTGTGNITVSGSAPTGFRTLSAVATADSDTLFIAIVGGAEWETSLATRVSANEYARTTVIESSNSNAAVNFAAGTKDVFVTKAAGESTWLIGGVDRAAPTAQTWKTQSVATGTSNTAAIGLTRSLSCPTGTGTAGTEIIQSSFSSPTAFASTVTMTIASPCVVTLSAHGMVTGQPIVFTTTGALPTGITSGATYYVISVASSTTTFRVATSAANAAAGTAINTSGSQSGTHTGTTLATVQNPALPIATWGPSGLTGSQATSLLDLKQTWNTSGAPIGLKLNIANVTNSSGKVAEFQVNGTAVFSILSTGRTTLGERVTIGAGAVTLETANGGSPDGVRLGSTSTLNWSSTSVALSSSADLFLVRDAAATLAQRNTTTAQVSRLYRTYTDASNYERLTLQTGSGYVEVAAETAGTGTDNLDVRLTAAGTGKVTAASAITANSGTAIPAGGTAGAGLMVSSTANFGVFFGSGAPSLTAAKGSLYLRSDGSTTNDRAYINSDGGTTWTALTTAA